MCVRPDGPQKATMKLLTKENLKALPPLGALDKNPNLKAAVKFFGGSSYTFYAFEFDGDDMMFGYVTGLFEDELGYTSLSELKSVKFPPFGLGIERDKFYTPQTLAEIQAKGN